MAAVCCAHGGPVNAGRKTYNRFVRCIAAVILVSFLALSGCSRAVDLQDSGSSSASPAADSRPSRAKVARHLPTSDPEERRRRSEAVRRAAEELATRGVVTNDYLMNLIADEEVYTVSFVSKHGRSLHTEISVRIRRENFDVLSVEGSGLDGSGASKGLARE